MNGGYAAKNYEVGKKESILLQLEFQGICERGDYALFPVDVGDFKLYTIKFRTSPVSSMYESVDAAVEEFIKLTH
jgi:hypothetical protein